jgi:hypothetical protein
LAVDVRAIDVHDLADRHPDQLVAHDGARLQVTSQPQYGVDVATRSIEVPSVERTSHFQRNDSSDLSRRLDVRQ